MGVHDFISTVQRNGQCIYGLSFTGQTTSAVDDPTREARITRPGISDAEFDAILAEDPSDAEEIEASNLVLGEGSMEDAILVKVPKKHTKAGILAWPLKKFFEFESFASKYSWDSQSFGFENDDDRRHYSDQISDESACKGVWESPQHPGVWLVCFLETEYKAFVTSEVDPNKIPRMYYKTVFEERGVDLPATKVEAFAMIARAFVDAVALTDMISDDDPLWEELGI